MRNARAFRSAKASIAFYFVAALTHGRSMSNRGKRERERERERAATGATESGEQTSSNNHLPNRRRAIIPLISRIPREFRLSRVSLLPSPRAAWPIRSAAASGAALSREQKLAAASRTPLYIKWCSRFTGQIESRTIGRFSISPDNGLCYRSSTSSRSPSFPAFPLGNVSPARGLAATGDAAFRDPWERSMNVSPRDHAAIHDMCRQSDRFIVGGGRMSMPRDDATKNDIESES